MILVLVAHRWSGMKLRTRTSIYLFSCDGITKTNIWTTQPTTNLATINYKRGEKKREDRQEQVREQEICAEDQQTAQNHGYCYHQHVKVAKTEHKKYKKQPTETKEGKGKATCR
jgi:hypothetical protein